MRIRTVEIEEFGKLTDLTLTLNEGMNLIEGKNESGKSTLLAFLRFVLYGFPRRSGANAEERDKRLSWRGKRAAGTLTLSVSDGEYRIHRDFFLRGNAARETASEELTVICVESGERISLDGKTPGEYFLGLPAELYDSSLCLAQSDAARVADPAVREALGDLLFSQGTTLCAEDAEKKLDNARRLLKHNKGVGGRIPQLEAEQSRLDGAIKAAENDAEKLAEIRESIYRCRTKIEKCQAEEQALAASLEYAELAQTVELFEQKSRAVTEREHCALELTRAQASLASLPDRDAATRLAVALHDVEGARDDLARYAPEIERLEAIEYDHALLDGARFVAQAGGDTLFERIQRKQKAVKSRTVAALICLALAAGAAASGALLPPLFVASGVLLLAAVVLAVTALTARKAVKEALSRLQVSHVAMLRTKIEECERAKAEFDAQAARLTALRTAYGNEKAREEAAFTRLRKEFLPFGEIGDDFSLQDAAALLREINERRGRAEKALADATLALERTKTYAESLTARLQALDEEAIRARLAALTPPTEPIDNLKERKALLARTRAEQSARLGDLERAEAALGATSRDPHALMRERVALDKELNRARERFAAISMAMEALGEANEELRRGITPQLRQDAATIFAALTERAEDALILGPDFSLSLTADGKPLPLSRFSAGCRDAAHLSLRLALLATLSEEKLPLFFDEAFARLDDGRAAALLEVLQNYCKHGGQALLFTCHTRERGMLAGSDFAHFTLGEAL